MAYGDNFCPVEECVVCEGWPDETEAGYCKICGGTFHWGNCGGWVNNEHVCNNCKDALGVDDDD
jgi:hypothetical protein